MQLPEYDPAYDPVEHLESMGYRLIRHTLRDCWAMTLPQYRRVLWDPRMPKHMEWPVFGHEDAHVINGDPGGHHPRNEARADLHTALRNVNPEEWDRLMGIHHDYDAICLELRLSRAQFREYHAHRQREDARLRRLERYGNALYLDPKMGAGQYAARFEGVA